MPQEGMLNQSPSNGAGWGGVRGGVGGRAPVPSSRETQNPVELQAPLNLFGLTSQSQLSLVA